MNLFSSLTRLVYQWLIRPILFRQDPEKIHDKITVLGQKLGANATARKIIKASLSFQSPQLAQSLWGITFNNPVGLAAGFDKNAQLYSIMPSVGFGFSEVGTVTFGDYAGNPPPRLYRLPKSKGVVVNYGLKNIGAQAIIESLKTKLKPIPQIISIGRTNNLTTAEQTAGINDYYQCLNEFIQADVGDIYEINISCPNSFDGEPFTDSDNLTALLTKLYSLNITKPIFLKMPINLEWGEFQKLLDCALDFDVSAVVIGNLNKDRANPLIKDIIPKQVRGSISGKPTSELSNRLISATYKYCGDKVTIIGVGGIFSAQDAYEKIKRGASLIQLITGMIYRGPQLIGEINRGLLKLLRTDGFSNITEAVGTKS